MSKIISKEYSKLLNDLKKKVASSQAKAVLAVNKELVLLYWNIGNKILENQNTAGWGAKIIDLLSIDLSKSFPENKGFSVRNLKYMHHLPKPFRKPQLCNSLLHKYLGDTSFDS